MTDTAYRNNIEKAFETGSMLMPNGSLFSMDGYSTKLNNNVIAMGTSGSFKTRSVITPNLLSRVGSYIVSDPKGNLCKKYGRFLKQNGYNVVKIDFIHPENSDGYNPLSYISKPDEIMKLSHYITYSGKDPCHTLADPFWDQTANLLLSALIGYIIDSGVAPESRTIAEIGRLMTFIDPSDIEERDSCAFDRMVKKMNDEYKARYGEDAWSFIQYEKFRQTPPRTFNCIMTTIHGNIGTLDTPELNTMYCRKTLDFTKIATEKTAVFVIVSDSDRSRDTLVNTFYSQAMNALCLFADDCCEDNRLPVPVRFMLDDFGTNCRIDGFENMISNIRSRGISATIVLQSVSQLTEGYGFSAHTIMDNCDTFIYMGGNDIDTAATISRRANKPLSTILDMPVGTNYVFRRGQKPMFSRTIDIDEYDTADMLKYAQARAQ